MRAIALAFCLAMVSSPAAAGENVFSDLIPDQGLGKPDGWTWKATGQAEVIDGDTIRLRGVKIRLWGIDAPEMKQMCEGPGGVPYGCGVAAKVYLEGMIGQNPVACFGDDKGTDLYGRQLAICHVANPVCLEPDGTTRNVCLSEPGPSWSLANINANMVHFGWALAYRQYSKAYVGYEATARDERRGIWAGRFDAPWKWRKNKLKI